MKYSQAVLVACIGGAALVSARPTHHQDAKVVAPPAPAAIPATTADAVKETVQKPAALPGQVPSAQHPQAVPAATLPKKVKVNHKKERKADHNTHVAVSNPGTVKHAEKPQGIAPASTTSTVSGSTVTASAPRALEDELEARFFDNLKQKLRQAKAERLQKEAAKAQQKANEATASAGIPIPPAPSPAIVAREFDEVVEARELAEVPLMVRNIKDWWNSVFHKESKTEKAQRLQNQANLAAKKANTASTEAGMTPPATREFFDDELEAREFHDEVYDLASRDYFDDELEMRDYLDEDGLVLRDSNIWDAISAVTRTFTPGSSKSKAADVTPAGEEPAAREYFDDFDLRDLLEIDELD